MKSRKSIRARLLTMGVLPIVLLGISIFIFGSTIIYSIYSDAIREELETNTYILKGCFDLTVRGDYTYEQDILMKGDVNISDSTMLYEIKDNSDVDTTIFWGDSRVLTTIENSYGASVVGTQASPDVTQVVLEKGENYFSNNLIIEDQHYIGYYTPLLNGDGSVVGMVFAGRPKLAVYQSIVKVMLTFLLLTLVVVLCSMIVWRRYSTGLVKDINVIKSYLYNIASGDLTATIDQSIVDREDEIGEIGIYADKMRGALKIMVELDSLTLLYNRRTCNRMIRKLVEEEKMFTVVMADIDYFKKINDQYGHACGDYILKNISSILKDSVKDCGFASRWGGEEFLLIYELDFEATKEKVEQMLEDVRQSTFEYEGQSVKVTMTIGVKGMEQGVPYEKIIKVADDNLYTGKRNGRNQIVYEEEAL